MGRTVEDVARVFNVVAGYDPADFYTEDGRGRKESDYTRFLQADRLEGIRVGVLRALIDAEADTAVVRLFEAAIVDLGNLGADIIDPLGFDLATQLARPNMFCKRFRYDMGLYLASLGDSAPIRDVLEVLETGQHAAHSQGGLRFFGEGPLDVHPGEGDPPCPDFFEHQERQAYLAALVTAMDEAQLDALVYPSWNNPPAHIDRAQEEYRGDNSQLVAPATGMPAITVPMGFTYGDYPAGLQILARPYAEGLLFRLAYAYEQGTRHRHAPNGFPER
jgi:Asp-tRNA(Asn)/Glu-tRNA(Gln) amidotransferase A subunit family amidase